MNKDEIEKVLKESQIRYSIIAERTFCIHIFLDEESDIGTLITIECENNLNENIKNIRFHSKEVFEKFLQTDIEKYDNLKRIVYSQIDKTSMRS